MKRSSMIWLAYIIAWLSTSLAVCVGIYFTHSIKCLWFLLIPGLINIKSSSNDDDEFGEDIDERQ